MKRYKAIFFDWDGTAVLSRRAPADDAIAVMRPLLAQGVKLCIVSGTTYENIAGGRLHEHFTSQELSNLYLGLGRGAFDYGFDADGQPQILVNRIPDADGILAIHDACYHIHRTLLAKYDLNTDIVFTRPNYCKIDMMPANDRGDNLFLQEGEATRLQHILNEHGIESIETLIRMAEENGTVAMPLRATTDAKYLEVGPTGKCDNVDALFTRFGYTASECCFWGDEFVGVTDTIYGSDAGMLTDMTKDGDFYDVSNLVGVRPAGVEQLGGGIQTFHQFLAEQSTL